MTDNLLDPSHVSWVHQSSFGGVQAMEDAPLETTVGADGVTVWRWVVDAKPAPFYAPFSNSLAIATASSTTRCATLQRDHQGDFRSGPHWRRGQATP
ncbi:hypothetical protein ACFSOZ_29705 [Mesorhizobium newzealandense]|uniref:Vanillate O-demethylase oxygenase-like C-terminal catalytic domain-containing protein n=1 Tax=Mesorhizobium newzealandense TaxID=1300302 RepID=A0ABW4UI18_9HYPH